jgi:hypothetical protein
MAPLVTRRMCAHRLPSPISGGLKSVLLSDNDPTVPMRQKRAFALYTRGTLTTEYVVVGVGGVVNRALIA